LFDQKTGKLQIGTALVFEPLLQPARYKGAWGGRGSGKSHFFAELVVDEHVSGRGLRTLCVREVLKSLKESAKLLIEDKIRSLGVGHLFEVQKDRIKDIYGGFIVFEGMQDHNAEYCARSDGPDDVLLPVCCRRSIVWGAKAKPPVFGHFPAALLRSTHVQSKCVMSGRTNWSRIKAAQHYASARRRRCQRRDTDRRPTSKTTAPQSEQGRAS